MFGLIYHPGVGLNPPRLSLALQSPLNQQQANRVGVSTPCGPVSTPRDVVFVPDLLKFEMYRHVCDPGKRYHSPESAAEVRRCLERQVARRALDPQTPASPQPGAGIGFSTPCAAISTWGYMFSSPGCWRRRCIEV